MSCVNTESRFLKGAIIISRFHPWTWIAIVFGTQMVGALLVTLLLKVDIIEAALPILLLATGMAVASVVRWLDPTFKSMFLRWSPAVIYSIFIFSLSHQSFEDVQPGFDTNLLHPVEYATLGIFFSWAWKPLLLRKGILLFTLAVLFTGIIYGLTDEFHQSFIPGRLMSYWDLTLDIFGLLLGCGVFLIGGHVQERLKTLEPQTDMVSYR